MPVEYLLVDVPCGVRKQEHSRFNTAFFPAENRTFAGQNQVSAEKSQNFEMFRKIN